MTDHRYAELSDYDVLGIPAAALSGFSDADKITALETMSSEADGYLNTKHVTPLTSWPRSLTLHVTRGAVYILITSRGMNPNAAGNELIIKGYDDAIAWFGKVSRGMVVLPATTTSPAGASIPQITSTASRYG
jgi:phage gp36-like protein